MNGRRRFHAAGLLRNVTWSPDGRWLAFAWPEADQIVFVSTAGPRRIEAAANLTTQFEATTPPRIGGWCAASS